MDFAVWHEGIEEGQARWVLAVDGEHVLLADSEQQFYWKALSDCKFARLAGPDQPRLVMPVSPVDAGGPGLALPNRAVRRQIERNGF